MAELTRYGRYQQLLGCNNVTLSNTTNYYARYTTSLICNSIVQNSIRPCQLSDATARPLCADSCVCQEDMDNGPCKEWMLTINRLNKQYRKKRLLSILPSAVARAPTLSIKFAPTSPTALFLQTLSAAPAYQVNKMNQITAASRQICKVYAATALLAPRMPRTRAVWAPTSTSAALASPYPTCSPCHPSTSQRQLLQLVPLRQGILRMILVFLVGRSPASSSDLLLVLYCWQLCSSSAVCLYEEDARTARTIPYSTNPRQSVRQLLHLRWGT